VPIAGLVSPSSSSIFRSSAQCGNPRRIMIDSEASQVSSNELFESLSEAQAYELTRCAIAIDNAYSDAPELTSDLAAALNANLDIWVALRTLVAREDCLLDENTCKNLTRLADFVADRTFSMAESCSEQAIETLIKGLS